MAELFSRPIERRNANVLLLIPSSLLSDGRRPLGVIVETRFPASLGIADGQRVVRVVSWLGFDLFDARESTPGLLRSALWLLSVRVSSILKFRFSTISPPPAIMTGLILSRRKGSLVVGFATARDELALRSRPDGTPAALVLLPRRPYLPYPSWPVPAAGPLLVLLCESRVGTSGAVFVLLPNNPNLGLGFATLGLGVRETVPLAAGGICCGLRSGIIPSPVGAGVASRGDG